MPKYSNIEEISNSLRAKLKQVKPLLPNHFVKEIRKAAPYLSKTQIHNAFGTRAVKLNILQEVYNQALELAYKQRVSTDEADKKFDALIESL